MYELNDARLVKLFENLRPPKNMNQDPIQQIAQVDEKLKILRESWMDAAPEKKSRWIAKINEALDERSKLMKKRDAIPA